MPKHKVVPSYKLFSLHIPLLALAAVIALGGYVYTEKAKDPDGFVLGEKSKDTKTKPVKTLPEKNSQDKPVKTPQVNPNKANQQPVVKDTVAKDKPQAPANKGNPRTVSEKIMLVAEQEEEVGNTDVSADLEYAAVLINDVNDGETAELLDELESQPKWQTLLVGTDYKNLGQLRSQMVQNRNTIKKLTKTMEQVQGEDSALMLQQQIATLEQQQTQLQTVLAEKEDQFSVLGWVFRFLSGYDSEEVDATVQDVVEVDESTETTDPLQNL